MTGERYVVLGLAQVRAPWFREVARWATSAMVPADFVKCVSTDEVRARLASGRPYSALLVDGGLHGVDRDLCDAARAAGAAVIAVTDGRAQRDWAALGVSAVLDASFDRGDLLAALDAHAAPIGRADRLPDAPESPDGPGLPWRGALIAVTGSGGTGASTLAMAVAQGLGADPRHRHLVLLADLALDADLAMLHDARDVVPGVQELVEAFRNGSPAPHELRSLVFDALGREYHLLLGLRRHRDWTAIRPRAFEAALDALRQTYRYVVADIEADVEGEDETGAVEVEERNLLARTVTRQADVVVVVGGSTMTGLHSLVRTVNGLLDHGVDPTRILPAINRVPRSPRLRSELSRVVADLLADPRRNTASIPGPVFLPERKRLDDLHRDASRLPDQLAAPLAAAVIAALDRLADAPAPALEPQPVAVAPGSLGAWTDDEVSDR